jgi:hypothetical protein
MRIVLLVPAVFLLGCAGADNRQTRAESTAQPNVLTKSDSLTPVATEPITVRDCSITPAGANTTPNKMPTQAELLTCVRRLPLDSFPALPSAVRSTLAGRHCQVPQVGGSPNNVVSGAFTAKDKVEWAVLCSVRDSSQILVVNAVTGAVVDSLEKSADSGWIQGNGPGKWMFSEMISVVPMTVVTAMPAEEVDPSIPRPIDHDGIGEWYLDKGGVTHYSDHGRWYRIASDD